MTTRLPPDYAMHDAVYRRLRERGAIGWDTDLQGYEEMFQLVAPLLPPLTDGNPIKVLEIGCGAGNLSMLLAANGYAVQGVDIAPTAIAWAQERATGTGITVNFCVDNVLTLDSCADASFEAVVDGHCLHCIIGADRARCLAAARRVLKPGGVFLVLTMCGEVTHQAMLQSFDGASKVTVHGNRPTRYIGTAEDIMAEVAGAGFELTLSQVQPRKDDNDMDNLVILASKHKPD